MMADPYLDIEFVFDTPVPKEDFDQVPVDHLISVYEDQGIPTAISGDPVNKNLGDY